MSEKILIIDGLGIFFAAFAADPSVNLAGDHIGGTKGFLRTLQKISREVKPSQIFVVWDGQGGSSRRKSWNKEYKDGRKAVNPFRYNRTLHVDQTDEEVQRSKVDQLQRVIKYLSNMPVKQFVQDGIEADDIIAFLTRMPCLDDYYKVILSNDKDFLQLLDDKTIVYRPAVKKFVTRPDVIEEYGIHPNNMTLARAICGDKSDNLQGVPGVGMKTVSKYFPFLREEERAYVDDIIKEVRKMEKPTKALKKIIEHRQDVTLNYKIMQLYHPEVSKEIVEKLEDLACSNQAEADWQEIGQMMLEDGFGVLDWNSLKQTLRGISLNKDESNEW